MSTWKRPLRSDELMHYGIMGMHWGIRRFQNPDGTLTEKGKLRVKKMQNRVKVLKKKHNELEKKYDRARERYSRSKGRFWLSNDEKKSFLVNRRKRKVYRLQSKMMKNDRKTNWAEDEIDLLKNKKLRKRSPVYGKYV